MAVTMKSGFGRFDTPLYSFGDVLSGLFGSTDFGSPSTFGVLSFLPQPARAIAHTNVVRVTKRGRFFAVDMGIPSLGETVRLGHVRHCSEARPSHHRGQARADSEF